MIFQMLIDRIRRLFMNNSIEALTEKIDKLNHRVGEIHAYVEFHILK